MLPDPHGLPCVVYHTRMETLETLSADLRTLKSSVQRQRIVIASLVGILGIGAFIGATRPAGDATFDTITCKQWIVVDKDGKARITAKTRADGEATVAWFDTDEKLRIGAGTWANGNAGVGWADNDGKKRISAMTFADGQARVQWLDKDEKPRISAKTLADGEATVLWLDKDGKQRIAAATLADGQVVLPTTDREKP